MVWPLRKKTSSALATDEVPQGEVPPTHTGPQNTDSLESAGGAQQVTPSVPSGAYRVPKGYRIAGAVATNRPVVVEGELAGTELNAQEVYVRSGGALSSPAVVGSLVVEGVVQGPVSARESVEVKPGGVLRGAVESPALTVAPGGVISGAQLSVGRQT